MSVPNYQLTENEQRLIAVIAALVHRFSPDEKVALTMEEIEDAPELSTFDDFPNDRFLLKVRKSKK